MPKTIVLTFGTYDRFHPGHAYFLTEAKKHGDYLITVIARDHNVTNLKGKQPKQTELMRLQAVQNFESVNKAMLGLQDFSKKEHIIILVQPTIICLGYDQWPSFPNVFQGIPVIRLTAFHPEKYKSSLLA